MGARGPIELQPNLVLAAVMPNKWRQKGLSLSFPDEGSNMALKNLTERRRDKAIRRNMLDPGAPGVGGAWHS